LTDCFVSFFTLSEPIPLPDSVIKGLPSLSKK
jgi:hypothetical protein